MLTALSAQQNEQADGELSDQAMRAIADRLTAQGLDIRSFAEERSRLLKITNARGMLCELTIREDRSVTWECRPFSGSPTGSAEITKMVLAALGSEPRTDDPSASPALFPGLTLKGAAGRALREHGMQVVLSVLDCDDAWCEVYAEIEVTNPARRERGTAHVDDDGVVLWESHLSHLASGTPGIGPEEIARAIGDALTGRVRR